MNAIQLNILSFLPPSIPMCFFCSSLEHEHSGEEKFRLSFLHERILFLVLFSLRCPADLLVLVNIRVLLIVVGRVTQVLA